jgi:thiamine biosynthesis protein ThiS
MVISVSLNGESREVPSNLTLEGLVEWMKVPADRVAIERNLEIVPRRLWPETLVADGDHLEVVHFVGGGTPR